jgi:hypothetical protein
MNLREIKKNIIKFVEDGKSVDHVVDITTSNLSEDQKINLVEMFENDMIEQVKNTTSILDMGINETLRTILSSRLFVYPEPDETYHQEVYNEKLEDGTYSSDDFHDHLYNHLKDPITIKMEKWSDSVGHMGGGMTAMQNNLIQKRNKMIYDFSDQLANAINKNNIDTGIYINQLDSAIQRSSSNCNILCGLHLKQISQHKHILTWNTLTTSQNYTSSSDETFGQYKLVCKLQWDFANKSMKPCFGSVQIDECEILPAPVYYSIFTKSFDNIKNLETNIRLMYNKLNDIRETTTISY